LLELKNLSKHYPNLTAVEDLSLSIRAGEFFCLLGPSGCGKTTTLRMIAGFETADVGTILLNGEDVTNIPPFKRNVNTVFQNYAIFPHMNVFDNIAFGLNIRKINTEEIQDRVSDAIKMMSLEGLEKRSIGQLSGGEQQRVSLARALINKPKILLLDEPLSALDAKLRNKMQIELANLQREIGITFIFVTHNQEEALTMADRIAIMNKGTLAQLGIPEDVYTEPVNRFVADFIGGMNFFEGTTKHVNEHQIIFNLNDNTQFIKKSKKTLPQLKRPILAIRPEQFKMKRVPGNSDENSLGAVIENEVFYGDSSLFIVRLESGQKISVMFQNYLPSGMNPLVFYEGEKIFLCWNYNSGTLLEA
jgi:spermidine/putrescine transport system ATP-binding protein